MKRRANIAILTGTFAFAAVITMNLFKLMVVDAKDFQKIADGSAEQERNQKNQEIGGTQCHLYSHDNGDKSAAGEDDFLESVLQVLPYQKTYQRTYDYSCAVDEYSKHGSIIEKMTELGKVTNTQIRIKAVPYILAVFPAYRQIN